MGGFFGVVSKENCNFDLLYGTDYHSHLGTRRGGIVIGGRSISYRRIHDITRKGFRPQLEDFAVEHYGTMGIGVVSDYEDQPIFSSRFGGFYVVHVGRINNLVSIVENAHKGKVSFSEPAPDETMPFNPAEVIAYLIGQGNNISDGIEIMQNTIEGSSSVLVMSKDGIYAARDKLGRTPVIIAKKDGAYAATMETTALCNQGFKPYMELGPGQIVRLTLDGCEQLKEPGVKMQICAFLWIYYGFPGSSYEGVNVEIMRNHSGEGLARADMKRMNKNREELPFDIIADIPDSGTGSTIGYTNESGMRRGRPLVKYTPSWPRSFMPQEQSFRDLVAKKKLITIRELIERKRILFCEDSIVRGTQLKDNIHMLFDEYQAQEIHMRPSCPPLTHACTFLNFSRSSSEQVLAARRAIAAVDKEDGKNHDVNDFTDENSDLYNRMVGHIRDSLSLTSLEYQRMDDLVTSIGLPKEKLCLGCWRDCNSCQK
ncbi:MAG: amidophosphoribosyltransferase [Nanoarchaeota archaeon]|nr:amidophosphoribosyltransferase [Nanoarchaeota archaeon]